MRLMLSMAALFAVLFAACSSGDNNIATITATIGATGGTVNAPSGSAIAGASVAIPAGALTADATVVVKSGSTAGTAVTGFNLVGPVVEITVKDTAGADLSLGAAATVTVPYNVGQAGTGTVILYKQSGLAAAEVVAGSTASGGSVTAQVTSFSRFWAMIAAAVNPNTLTVSSVAPQMGPAAGGTSVVISGSGFSTTGTTTVTFGGVAATNVNVLSATSLTCVTPAGANGPVPVEVTSGGNTGSLVAGYLYNSVVVLTVSSVAPNTGPEAGGTSVTITGAGFNTGQGAANRMVNVSFGIGLTALATNVTVVSDTTITCTTPAGTGTVLVGVAINDLATPLAAGGLVNGFTYTTGGGGITVTGANPSSGSELGGTTITVFGTGFPTTGTATVTIGGNAATNVAVTSATSLTCVTPAGTVGAKVITVSDGTNTGTSASGAFIYTAAPGIGTWSAQSTTGAPDARFGHGMVSIGSHAYIFGGRSFATNPQAKADGFSYNPSTNTWTTLPTTGAPTGRYWHQMIAIGQDFYVFGGNNDTQPGMRPDSRVFDTVANAWAPMDMTNAPTEIDAAVGDGAGNRIFVFGRINNISNLYIYDAIGDSWSAAATGHGIGNTVSFGQFRLEFTGSLLLAFDSSGGIGALYDPVGNSWTAMSATGAPTGRNLPATGFQDGHFIVYGGDQNNEVGGAMYNVSNDTWTAMATTGEPGKRMELWPVSTPDGLFMFGGATGSISGIIRLNDGYWFDPIANAWEKASTTTPPSSRSEGRVVLVGNTLVVFGGNATAGSVGVGANLTR